MADRLDTYRGKRDFGRTAEPKGAAAPPPGSRFVVHKHHATADHYDLRLELDGVLKSWAVPKGPSLDPADKRLAVETEDHPVEYIDFEGVIPEGAYGGGPMIVWDAGVWAPMEPDPAAALARGAFKFRLAGEKLHGGWMLARLKPKAGEKKRNWLLFKERDPSAEPGVDILAARPESVKSGRRIEELRPDPPRPAAKPAKPARLRPGALPGAVKAPPPATLAPQLAEAVEAPPSGPDWLHEIKLDGYRTLARVEGGAVRMITRGGLDWTRRYGALAEAFAPLPDALIDGEVLVLDAKGVSRFEMLQDALSRHDSHALTFFAFDLPWLAGWDLTGAPLARRKALLAELIRPLGPRSALQLSDHLEGDGAAFFDRAAEMGLEGVVSKRADAPYHPGRSRTWVKAKARAVDDFPVAGFSRSAVNGGLGALALGEWEEGELRYRGKVGTGFDAATIADLLARLEPLAAGAAPLDGAPRDVVPVRPLLTAHIHYSNRTGEGLLRHAVFKGLREMKLADLPAGLPRPRLISEADLASVTITNPKRRLFGRAGPTKLDVAVYYAAVGDAMLPHLLGRPVSLFRCPTGKPGDCFFQRHAFTGMPPTIARFEVETSDGPKTYISVEDARGYLALPQFGVIELHAWGCHREAIETPDRVTFDLDPGEGVDWRVVTEAAQQVRDVLTEAGLAPFVKTTGGKGVHVVVPLVPRADWKAIHEATGALARRIAATAPDLFTTTQGPENRKGRIFIDFHRNARSATAVAPYSLRARNNLPASTPISWENLGNVDAPADLNYVSVPELIAASGDPWADIDASARELPAAL
ncbi:MAG: DNA ligase D [Amaricoccus sp.]|nr:DNA ligase D [Amaricoccus sp.]